MRKIPWFKSLTASLTDAQFTLKFSPLEALFTETPSTKAQGHKHFLFSDILKKKCIQNFFVVILYLYSVQYLDVLQDSKCYVTQLTAQVQPKLSSN